MRIKCTQSPNVILFVAIALSICGALMHAFFGQSWESTSGHAIGSDDAFISFRYAENLFKGNGFVFNSGEYVEGYSNLLYTLLVVPGFLFGRDYVYPLSVGINCILLAASLYIFWKFCRDNLGGHYANIGLFLMALNPWIWVNASTGLETTLILFVTIGSWVSIERYRNGEAANGFIAVLIFCLISILSRVDGFILPIVAAFYLFITGDKKGSIRIAFFVVLCMAIYTIFRFFYYDDFIANTFYNKASGDVFYRVSRGLVFLDKNLIKTGLVIGILSAYFYFLKKDPSESILKRINFAAVFLISWVCYLVYIGGDIYYERFIVQLIPLIVYTTLSIGGSFKEQHTYIVFVALFAAPMYYSSTDGRFDYSSPKYDMWVSLGKYLSAAPAGSTLAIDAAGKVPFFSGLPTIDMLGLNDKHIGKMKPVMNGSPGHEKFDPEYVISRAPTYIAAWISPNLDMGWGLEKGRYLEGYNLRCLVNSSRKNLGADNIIDVSKLSASDIQKLILGGHNYGLLLRKENLDDIGQLSIHTGNLTPRVDYHHNSDKLLFSGWSYPEVDHRWSSGHSSKIIFLLDLEKDPLKGELELKFSTLGEQHIYLSLNGSHIYSGRFRDVKGSVVIPIPLVALKNGANTLEFIMPNAKQPGNGDQRVLALALKSFQIR